jgi:hypothetical protein
MNNETQKQNGENTMKTNETTIEIFDPKKFNTSKRYFDRVNDKAFVDTAIGAALSCDPQYSNNERAQSCPHPNFIQDVENMYPGYILIYLDF